ncbi:MAG: enoyl-CoA hydratase/isomerase family protein [Chloroflexi bacterium]|nr:enoyl-CoA hydratase/isomerase family protein [Chloroflexota bacterium]
MPVRYEPDGHIVTITIDRPEALNAIDLETWQEFSEATGRLAADQEAWAGIITGAGAKAFCAGADLGSTIPRLMDDPERNPYPAPPTIMRGQEVAKPLIAAINGLALGGGLEIVLACDLRIAAENARFGSPEVNLGLIPGWGATQRLPRQLPWAIAARILLTGEYLSAEEALRVGLVNAVVPQPELMAEARRWAETLCQRGPLALRAAKRAMLEGAGLPLEEGLRIEQRYFNSLAYTDDLREGLVAFGEKRQPVFRGT